MTEMLRVPAEIAFAAELEALRAGDAGPKPQGWVLSPRATMTYLMGGVAADGAPISAKYVGDKRLIETAIATLATDRALLLLGMPGTAKSWVSEHLAAAVCGDSTMVIQGTAGTDENQIRYGWNYAQLLAHGPSRQALVPTPLFRAMENGKLCRLEELTRMGSDVQDTLITVLSEKMMPIAELNDSVYARRGFNIIATANNRDKGVNELSSALKRRFNVVVLPLPDNLEQEIAIVAKRRRNVARPRIAGAQKRRRRGRARHRHIPRIARRRDRRRKNDAEVAFGVALRRRSDRRHDRRPQPRRLLQRRQALRRRDCIQYGRRDRQGPRAGQGGAGGISRDRAEETARLRRLLPRA